MKVTVGEMRGSTMFRLYVLVIVLIAIIIPVENVGAMASVGIGTGKIEVSVPINVASTQMLGSISVYNDGDSPGIFSMNVMFNETQPELKPAEEWLTFTPSKFVLEPGAAQIVDVTISLPVHAEPGKYFAFLEAQVSPKTIDTKQTQTTIGAVAATKLLFDVSKTSHNVTESNKDKLGKTKNSNLIFEFNNDKSIIPDVTINKLLSFSTIL